MISGANTQIPDAVLSFGKGNSNLVFSNEKRIAVVTRAEVLGITFSIDDNPDNLGEFLLNYNTCLYTRKVMAAIDDFLFADKRFAGFMQRLSETGEDEGAREEVVAEIRRVIFGTLVQDKDIPSPS